ncbi:hypothetical protein AVEN_170980-1 [Araneus ventricosus]|uniref:Uncharacterized protein n=1 Tax=Araneus ventricosus TaxID=182803 RepID=A0A4Y2QZC6_ARAVE|nr:hypothetical protein AVEN_170980-1 [Araneus ventricosus]
MTRTTPELAPPSPNFRATPAGGRLATTYDLACNRPHTRRIFSGIGFRACGPPAPRLANTVDLQWDWVSDLGPSGSDVETLPLGHRGPLGCLALGSENR